MAELPSRGYKRALVLATGRAIKPKKKTCKGTTETKAEIQSNWAVVVLA